MANSGNSQGFDLPKWLGISIALLGVIATVLPNSLGDSTRLRIISVCGFVFLLASVLALAYESSSPNTSRLLLVLVYLGSCSYCVWVGTWLHFGSSPAPIAIDSGDSLSDWATYAAPGSAQPTVSLVRGRTTSAMELSYSLAKDAWVGITKPIDPQVLSGAKGIEFYYRGDGAPNTIELKLVYKSAPGRKTIVFHRLWNRATDREGWTRLRAPFGSFSCWDCPGASELKLDDVAKLDVAVSNKAVDTTGDGEISIDDIQPFD